MLVAALAAFTIGRQTAPAPSLDSYAASLSGASVASAQFGTLQARVHKAGVTTAPIVPFVGTLSLGAHGPAVREMQTALIHAKARPARDKATGNFGSITLHQVAAFQKKKRIRPITGQYGPRTHHALSTYYTLAQRGKLQAIVHARVQADHFARLLHAESVFWSHRGQAAYSEGASRSFLPLLPAFPRATDCSGFVTWEFKVSGLPDPNGFSYVVVGYTGTLARHGVRVSANGALHVGDLVFYGGGYPYGHVAIVVDAFRRLVASHGSPGLKVLPFNYRPVSAIRRYF